MVIRASVERGWGPVRVPAQEVVPAAVVHRGVVPAVPVRVASRDRALALAGVPVGAADLPASAAALGAPVLVQEREVPGPVVAHARTVVSPDAVSPSSAMARNSARSAGRSSGFLLRRAVTGADSARVCVYPGAVVPNTVVAVWCRRLSLVGTGMRNGRGCSGVDGRPEALLPPPIFAPRRFR